jgi:plastocyanin
MAVVSPHRGSGLKWFGIILAFLSALGLLVTPSAFADGGREIRLRDKCEPVSFNAAIGAGTCVGSGDVTFGEFLRRLNPKDGGHGAWNFTRSSLNIRVGEVVSLQNRGGEVHSFTEVRNFGTGVVDPLNAALPAGTGPAIPVDPPNVLSTFLPPGQTASLTHLNAGTHAFQCLIHPWMRTTIHVSAN